MADQTSENVTKRVKLDESNDTETQSRVWIAVPEHAHEYFSREVPNEFESLAFREKLLATSLCNGFSEDNPAATPTPLKERKAVFILGPSAAGKTRALRTVASQLLGETTTNQKYANSESITTIAKPALGAYVLDGANFRSVSKTWATLLKSATEHSFTQKEMEAMNVKSTQLDNKEQEFYLAGYSDGYKKFFKKPTDKLKKELTEHFIDEGFNTVIPDTCSNVETIVKQALALQENGYSLQVLFVYASRSVCERRGVQREIGEGKKYDSKNWQKSTEAMAYFLAQLRAAGWRGRCSVIDNDSDWDNDGSEPSPLPLVEATGDQLISVEVFSKTGSSLSDGENEASSSAGAGSGSNAHQAVPTEDQRAETAEFRICEKTQAQAQAQ